MVCIEAIGAHIPKSGKTATEYLDGIGKNIVHETPSFCGERAVLCWAVQCFFGASSPFKILTIANYEHTAALATLTLSLAISSTFRTLDSSSQNKGQKIAGTQ